MASRLDDPEVLNDLLTAWSAPPALLAALVAKGFDTIGKLACASSAEAAAEDAFLRAALPSEDPAASAALSCGRRLLRFARDQLSTSPPAPAPSGPAPSKLTPAEFRDMRARFQTNYPGELLTQDCSPSSDFLSLLRTSLDSGLTCWVPWRHRSSEADALHWLETRRPRSDGQLLRALLADQDPVESSPSAQVNMNAPMEPTVRKALSMLATALAMLGDVHLLVIKRFNDRFLSLALSRPADTSLRSPTLPEVLAADKAVWSSVTALMRDHSWKLSDALNEVAFCRQEMASALQPRPRPAQAPAPSPRKPNAPAPNQPKGGGGKKQTDKPEPAPSTAPPPKKAKVKEEADAPDSAPKNVPNGWDRSWPRKCSGKDICMRYAVERCSSASCRFSHVCPVPDAKGKPCGQKHSALQHQKAPR